MALDYTVWGTGFEGAKELKDNTELIVVEEASRRLD